MDQFVKSLQSELDIVLTKIGSDDSDILTKAGECINLLEKTFEDLKKFIKTYKFKNETEEIRFFKEIKPRLFSNLIFYRKVYNLELSRPKGDNKVRQDFLRQEMHNINAYFQRNTDMYFYHRTGCCHLDKDFFLRGKASVHLMQESFYFERDPDFSTLCDFKVAKILANELLETYLMEEIAKLDGFVPRSCKDIFSTPPLIWNGPKIDLIEIIYAIHETGYVSYGSKSFKLLVSAFEKLFSIDLGNISRAQYDLRQRDNPTKFLDKLKKILINKLNSYD